MATLSSRVLQLALKGYDFTVVAEMLGITPVEVDEVLKHQAHELAGGGGDGVPRDESGRPILPAIYAYLSVPECPLNLSVEDFALILGEGSIGHTTFLPLTLQTGPCTVPAGEVCHVAISGPHQFGPLEEVEFVITNLDGSETISAVAEEVELPGGVGPEIASPPASDYNVFDKTGEDLTLEESLGGEGKFMSAAGGTFFLLCLLQLPRSS